MADIGRALSFAVNRGDINTLRDLIHDYGLYYSEAHGYTLLRDSIKSRHSDITTLLIAFGSKVNSKRRKIVAANTPLHFAVENGELELSQLLLGLGADIDARNECGMSPLLIAIQKKNETIIDLLLKKGASLYSCNRGLSPLHVAVENRLCTVTEKLLEIGVLIDAQANCYFRKDYTPLHIAIENEDFAIVEVLLKNGASVNSKTEEGLTPMHLACKTGNLEIIELLLNRNADIHARANNSLTPLYYAVENSQREAAKYLMSHGAKIHDEFDNKKTVFSCAVDKHLSLVIEDILQYFPDTNNAINKESFKNAASKSGIVYSEITKNLMRYGFSVQPDYINDAVLLHNAIEMGYIEIIQDLIKHGIDLTSGKEENRNIMHIAEKYKQFEIAKLLLTHGADPNAMDIFNRPPIFYSTQNSDINMTKLLLLHGADVQTCPELLRIATKQVCKEIVEMLLETIVDIDAKDNCGRTALHLVALNECDGFFGILLKDETPEIIENKAEIAKMLLIKGANVNAKTFKDGYTALHSACAKEYVNVVEILLEYQADVECVVKGFTPLHIAAQNGNATIIGMLLKNRASINTTQENGYTALHIAAENGHAEAVNLLLKNGADVCLKSNNDETPLHLASKGTDPEIVALLLEQMSPIDSKNIDGDTPLHIAIKFGKGPVIDTLLNFGSDIDIPDSDYFRAMDLAYGVRYNEHMEFLGDELNYLNDVRYERCVNPREPSIGISLLNILLQAITLKAINQFEERGNIYAYLDEDANSLLRIREEECKHEIDNLKCEKIPRSKLSFYDILTNNIHSLATYTRNEDVIRIFESDCCRNKFPIYGVFIERKFIKATQRRQLLQTAHEVFKYIFGIPYECADKILSYLNNDHLENIIDACYPIWKYKACKTYCINSRRPIKKFKSSKKMF